MRKLGLRLCLLGLLGATALVVTASGTAMISERGSGAAAQTTVRTGATAAAAPRIPKVTIRFGFYPCCADTAVPVVGMRQGFFKDVGITISPSNATQFSQASQFLPAMQRGDQDIVTAFSTTWLSTLNTFGMNLPPALLYDIYLGRDIIVAPRSGFKTTADYMKQGMKFPAAARKAVAQLKGKTIYTDPFAGSQPPYYDILFSYGKITSKDVHFQFLSDDKILAASATPGRVPFAFPLAAPILVQMLRNGYRSVIDMASIIKYDGKSSQAKALLGETGNQTVMIQRSLLDKDPDTIERFISVVYRSIAFLKNPKTAPIGDKEIADVINAAQGLQLIPKDIATVYNVVDPLFPFEQQGATLWNPKSQYYAPRGYQNAVNSLIANKSLPPGSYDLKKFLVAKTIYARMKSQQAHAKALFKKAAKVKGSRKALVARARKFYSWYDFLDAVRFLKAATAR
jgi:ABC-type nitrate/sulfonate/bicarbonate transport system substrate-binding protein